VNASSKKSDEQRARGGIFLTLGALGLASSAAMLAVVGSQPVAVPLIGAFTALMVALAIALFKGKLGTVAIGLIAVKFGGLLLWFVAASRLAKPNSIWSRAFYSGQSEKLNRSRVRFAPSPPHQRVQRGEVNARPRHSPVNVYVDARSVHFHHPAPVDPVRDQGSGSVRVPLPSRASS
jgi:hypothetical protein